MARARSGSASSLKNAAAICERPALCTQAKMTLSTAAWIAAGPIRLQRADERADEAALVIDVRIIDTPHLELDVHEPGAGELELVLLLLESARKAADPQVHVPPDHGRDVAAHDDVRDSEA